MSTDEQQRRATVATEALTCAFLAMGRAGANHNLSHPLRPAWEDARRALMDVGALRKVG